MYFNISLTIKMICISFLFMLTLKCIAKKKRMLTKTFGEFLSRPQKKLFVLSDRMCQQFIYLFRTPFCLLADAKSNCFLFVNTIQLGFCSNFGLVCRCGPCCRCKGRKMFRIVQDVVGCQFEGTVS